MLETVVATQPSAALAGGDAQPTSTSTPAAAKAAGVAVVADTVLDLMHSFTKVKAKMVESAQNDVEWAANVLLRSLGAEGPMRASVLAESVGSDLSTVSRQVAALVRSGLLERRADQVDGRACLLVPTDAGQDVIVQHDRARTDFFSRMLTDWNSEDLDQFGALLSRFTSDYSRMNREWLAERSADLSREPETGTK